MILVFGQTGQVAQELQRLMPDAVFWGRNRIDLRDPGATAKAIREAKPEAVINAAAYTAVDKAEEEEALAQVVNGDAPAAMAEACRDLGIPVVHISTDYVFDGSGDAPFKPTDLTDPLGAYGRTKLAGEEAIRATGSTFAILRTSWVFSAHGGNFVKTMLRLSESRDHLTIVADQIGGPTPAKAIAEACLTIAEELQRAPEKSGVYHFSGSPDVSWAGFAREIFARAGRDVTVEDIPTADYPTPAKRPLNSRLDCSDLAVFGLNRPDWRSGLDEVLTELGAI
ncbi:dTDP-4-dehydrorhamnose reductase [Thioclava sp. DLFJ5-1]|uniref:dTDP-4-dehydrorhamnose reductase n=1 Tax=Thioclava sp. DLFJ5-1 TaxID=1915314 RepID=UPI000996125A|nr:dTDP-4-dehydrorhamnose reductase [Thioclava sp. DLFJ5-1]OOY20080.1 dTDP-4-dehydrorhamnose reductase [Thioclava sp. DLFJ5-1]